MSEREIQVTENDETGEWDVYVDGSIKGSFETEAEANRFADLRARS